jgi:hypothetical protein
MIAAIQGGNVWQGITQGAITGAISGAMFYAAGSLCIMAKSFAEGAVLTAAQVGIHATAGAASGVINASITGGDIGREALIGAMSAGASRYFGGKFPQRILIGSAMGGISSVAAGGDFFQGAWQGAWTSAISFVCNEIAHRATLYFNGKVLEWRVGGKTEKSWSANSGSDQSKPIPEGSYHTSPGDRELHTGREGSWGPFSYRLHEGYITGILNRISARDGGFHIHGGYSPGTAGCIEFQDYAIEQNSLHEFDKAMKSYGETIILWVQYD